MTPRYCIAYEDGDEVRVVHPTPLWLGMMILFGYSEREAMEDLAMKVLPARLFEEGRNRQGFYIIPRASLPDRAYRNAWILA